MEEQAPAFSSDLQFSDRTALDLENTLVDLDRGGGGGGDGASDAVDVALASADLLPPIDLALSSACIGCFTGENPVDGAAADEEADNRLTGRPSCSRSSTFSERSVAESCDSFVSAASRLEPYAEREELQKMFDAFDENGDGRISRQELGNTMQKLGFIMSESELESMVLAVDNDGDGFVDFNEFLALYSSLYYEEEGRGPRLDVMEDEEELKEAFAVFDKNKDGFISVVELQAVLSSLGLKEGVKLVDCQKMIRAVDSDGDGLVNFGEFKNMMGSAFLNVKRED